MNAYMMGLSPEKIVNTRVGGLRASRKDLSDSPPVTPPASAIDFLNVLSKSGYATQDIVSSIDGHDHANRRPLRAATRSASDNIRDIRAAIPA
ncbi:MAG: hypothetical protein LBR53_10490 [Deltaproteobacteria bacterium]|jgi:hypothetical protein|nr:hypothetical protein [Deltaproteobacteria bacterium]